MSDDDILRQVLRAAGASEGSEVRTFEVYRDGNGRHLQVKVHDYGPGTATGRYAVEVRDAEQPPTDAPYSMGNPGRSLDEALSNAHWNEFSG